MSSVRGTCLTRLDIASRQDRIVRAAFFFTCNASRMFLIKGLLGSPEFRYWLVARSKNRQSASSCSSWYDCDAPPSPRSSH